MTQLIQLLAHPTVPRTPSFASNQRRAEARQWWSCRTWDNNCKIRKPFFKKMQYLLVIQILLSAFQCDAHEKLLMLWGPLCGHNLLCLGPQALHRTREEQKHDKDEAAEKCRILTKTNHLPRIKSTWGKHHWSSGSCWLRGRAHSREVWTQASTQTRPVWWEAETW